MGDIPTASMFNVVPPPNRPKIKANPPSAKTIKTSGAIRVGQACDRCRAKKTKCDGKLPTCSSCAAVGFKCIVSDKLSRRAFPKGYTETLEERIRQLEAENKKLVGLIDLRDEQISMLNSELPEANVKQEEEKHDIETPQSTSATPSSTNPLVQGLASATASARVLASVEAGSSDLTSSNLSLLESRNNDTLHSHRHDHHDGVPCSCSDFPNMAIHEGPVSVSGSIFDENLHSKQSVSIPGSIILSDNEDNDSLLSFDDMDLCDDRYDHNNRKHRRHSHNNRGRNGTRDVSPAPGAFAAATAIAHMQKLRQHPVSVGITGSNNRGNEQQLLTQLVAISIPRLTEETLVIPTLLAKVCQVYGYSSKPAILTANAIASLKESATDTTKKNILEYYTSDSYKLLVSLIINRYDLVNKLPNTEASFFIHNLLNLPPSRIDLDHLITIYFQDWGNMLPILDKNVFLKDYIKFLEFLDTPISSNNDTSNASTSSSSSSYELIEKFGAILILILSLSILSTKSSLPANNKKYLSYLQNFDYLIREFVKPNCIITKTCSIQSLQILTLSLQYCLVTGDISTCYELRGRVITMGQQLRLHRCPAAVLGIGGGGSDNDVHLQNFRQGERRILFWCIYSLDVYSSLSLGVPRLLKDFEIECAIPFSGKDGDGGDDDTSTDNVNILVVNNTPLSIVGKVSKFCLSVMLYSKVLANILDSIFSRYESGDQSSKTLSRERMLDTWRRELPKDLKFEIDVNGLTLINNKDHTLSLLDGNIWKNYSNQQLTLIFLYYHAKILIYLPVISKHGNEHHNVGLSQKEQLFKPKGDFSANVVSLTSLIQQSAIRILEILKSLSNSNTNTFLLPIPMSLSREQARLSLLVAKGSLDYVKNGPLYQNLRQLLLETVQSISTHGEYDGPGGLTKNAVKILELAILSILGLNLNKSVIGRKRQSVQPIRKPEPEPKVSPSRLGGGTPTSKLVNVQTYNSEEGFTAAESSLYSNSRSLNGSLSSSEGYENVNNGIYNDNSNNINNSNNNSYDNNINTNNMNNFNTVTTSPPITALSVTGDDSIDGILEFDPFKMNLNTDLMMNEFAADGSLGLVPFLEMNGGGNYDNYSMENQDETW